MNRIRTTMQKALIVTPMMIPSFTLNLGLSSNSDTLGSLVGSVVSFPLLENNKRLKGGEELIKCNPVVPDL